MWFVYETIEHRDEKPGIHPAEEDKPLRKIPLQHAQAMDRLKAVIIRQAEIEVRLKSGAITREECDAHAELLIEAEKDKKTPLSSPILRTVDGVIRRMNREEPHASVNQIQVKAKDRLREYKTSFDTMMIFLLTNQKFNPLDHKQIQKSLAELDQKIPANYLDLNAASQEAVAQRIIDSFDWRDTKGVMHTPNSARIRRGILLYLKEKRGIRLAERTVSEKKIMAAWVARAKTTQDSEQAFGEAFEEAASEELKEEYRQYVHTWNQENVSDVFTPYVKMHEAIVPPTVHDSEIAEAHVNAQQGITLHLGENFRGEVHFENLRLNVRLCTGGKDAPPKLLIYDRNADTGVVGPVPLTEVRALLLQRKIDGEFSDQFEHFAPRSGDNDPAMVPDALVFDAIRQWLPENANDTARHNLLRNIACLLAHATPKYPTVTSRVKFFKYEFENPQSQFFFQAKQELHEKDFTESNPNFSLSVLANQGK